VWGPILSLRVGLFHMVVERASPMAIYSTFPTLLPCTVS